MLVFFIFEYIFVSAYIALLFHFNLHYTMVFSIAELPSQVPNRYLKLISTHSKSIAD